MIRLHGTCVVVAGAGVLLRGPSGAGKSDLALRLIGDGATLLADDYVEIERQGERLLVQPPSTISGLLEVRGVGILRFDHLATASLDLIIDLVAAKEVERLPVNVHTEDICGLPIRRLVLNPWEISAAIKVRLAVQVVTGTIISL
jgi:serine kinase of HPr protein (carbohydrate metabolism regulator)